MGKTETKYDLKRFIDAQAHSYQTALSEVRAGEKQSHWMWFIFPQLKGLGFSDTAQYYGIDGIGEAKAYLENEVLGARLIEITGAALALKSSDASEVFGYPDDLKFRSSMTLFSLVEPKNEIFQMALDKFFGGKLDAKTLELLKK